MGYFVINYNILSLHIRLINPPACRMVVLISVLKFDHISVRAELCMILQALRDLFRFASSIPKRSYFYYQPRKMLLFLAGIVELDR